MSYPEFRPEDILSAHQKQKRKAQGEGGVIFSDIEQAVLDNHIKLPEKKLENAVSQ